MAEELNIQSLPAKPPVQQPNFAAFQGNNSQLGNQLFQFMAQSFGLNPSTFGQNQQPVDYASLFGPGGALMQHYAGSPQSVSPIATQQTAAPAVVPEEEEELIDEVERGSYTGYPGGGS